MELVQPVVALVDVVAAEDTEDAGRRLRWWWKRFLRIVVAAVECDVVAAVGPVNDDTVVEVNDADCVVAVVAVMLEEGIREGWW